MRFPNRTEHCEKITELFFLSSFSLCSIVRVQTESGRYIRKSALKTPPTRIFGTKLTPIDFAPLYPTYNILVDKIVGWVERNTQ